MKLALSASGKLSERISDEFARACPVITATARRLCINASAIELALEPLADSFPPVRKINTPAEIKDAFLRAGVSVAQWARANGFTPQLVHEVLAGRVQARRGQSHRIAVLLGLKEWEIRL